MRVHQKHRGRQGSIPCLHKTPPLPTNTKEVTLVPLFTLPGIGVAVAFYIFMAWLIKRDMK